MQQRAKIFVAGEAGLPNDMFINLFYNDKNTGMYGFKTGDLIMTRVGSDQWLYTWFVEGLGYTEMMNNKHQNEMARLNHTIHNIVFGHGYVMIPLWATNRTQNAFVFYKDVVDKLRAMGMEVRMLVAPTDKGFVEKFCRDLTIPQREEMARWWFVCISINSWLDLPTGAEDYIYDAHFRLNDADPIHLTLENMSYGLAARQERFEPGAAVTPQMTKSQLDTLHPIRLLEMYRTLCKTTRLVYMVIRVPFLQRSDVLKWRKCAALRAVGLLPNEWVVTTSRFYQPNGTVYEHPKYAYLYIFMQGPACNWDDKEIHRAFQAYKKVHDIRPKETHSIHVKSVPKSAIVNGVYDADTFVLRKSMHPMSPSRIRHHIHTVGVYHNNLGGYYNNFSRYIGPSLTDQWYGIHDRILDVAIILSTVNIPVYVQLWIINWLTAYVHAPEISKIRLIESVVVSIRHVMEQRLRRRNPMRARRLKIDNKN